MPHASCAATPAIRGEGAPRMSFLQTPELENEFHSRGQGRGAAQGAWVGIGGIGAVCCRKWNDVTRAR